MESCRAILIQHSRWSETSLLVTWLTDRFGTLRTAARGALRPGSAFHGKLDLFHQCEISLTLSRTTTLHSLREVALIRPFSPVCASYAAMALASYFAELGAALAPPMQAAPEFHDLLTRALDHLTQAPPTRKALLHFESEAARLSGVLDSRGQTPPASALARLCGGLPASRQTALKAL